MKNLDWDLDHQLYSQDHCATVVNDEWLGLDQWELKIKALSVDKKGQSLTQS